jgi:Flp pilus assembly pilin Flp
LLALVVVVLIGTLTSLGAALNEKLKDIIDQVSGAS